MRRILLLASGVALGMAAIALVVFIVRPMLTPKYHSVVIDPRRPVGDFSLLATTGQRVKLSDYRGQVALVYFGYTFCPDVCPTTLVDVKRAFEQLGPRAVEAHLLMITVDPERDTPDKLAEYLGYFHAGFVGLTGSPEEILGAAHLVGAHFEKHEGTAATGYLIDHSAQIFVVDRQGDLALLIPFAMKPEDIAADLRLLLSE
jgi:protein SCO1/2